jgi:hypothetical protein
MSTSVKTKSPRGTSGPDAPRLELEDPAPELTPVPEPQAPAPASSNEPITPNVPDSSPDPAPAAGVVEESVKPVPLSASDLKLARQMNKAIAGVLGLSGNSRSVRV